MACSAADASDQTHTSAAYWSDSFTGSTSMRISRPPSGRRVVKYISVSPNSVPTAITTSASAIICWMGR